MVMDSDGRRRFLRLVITECEAWYSGRLAAHLPLAKRLIIVKADGSVLLHSDGGSYKPLNWMAPPCKLRISAPTDAEANAGVTEVWSVIPAKSDGELRIELHSPELDISVELGEDPGLVKEGVEAQLQELVAAQIAALEIGSGGLGHELVRREYPTAIGPVDILARSPLGGHVAIEIKRRGEIDGVEQLTRYLELLNRESQLVPVRGVFAAQEIKPQAKTLAEDRGIETLILDYDALRGLDDPANRLF